MPRIQQLAHSVVTKIAAGEVIERPASVLKELLENSVDAASTRVEIDVEAGGTELIRLVDNGCGIDPEDLPLAFASHATSKLRDADDLFRVTTMGFRGEALASIGGVAQVHLQSRAEGQPLGSEVTCHGGDLSPVKPWNGAPGTRIEVRHLFFNTPVRRKFLKTTATEMGHICEVFTRLSLAHPGLHLVLRHNGKAVYEVPGTADLRQKIGLFFGSEVEEKLYPIAGGDGDRGVQLTGFIADPSVERGNPRMQYLFVNGRWIRDRSLSHALQEAYRGLLMVGRYAVAFLLLKVPPDEVDVNVHPTKSEVRFRDGHALWAAVNGAIRRRLSAENLVPKLQLPSAGTVVAHAPISDPEMFRAPPAAPAPLPPPPIFPRRESSEFPPFPTARALPGEPLSAAALEAAFEEAAPGVSPRAAAAAAAVAPWEQPATPPPPVPAFGPPDVRAIQLYNAYLVLETPEGMLVIDQHALHERILFEQLKRRLREGSLETQRLLIPEPIELTREQAAITLEHRDQLAEMGLLIDDFGGGTLLLQGYPALIGNRDPQVILKAVVDHLCSKERLPSREVLFNHLLSLMACHSAVRSGDSLSPDQIAALLAQRNLADDTHHCPHGRPTQLLFSKHELDRQFGRI